MWSFSLVVLYRSEIASHPKTPKCYKDKNQMRVIKGVCTTHQNLWPLDGIAVYQCNTHYHYQVNGNCKYGACKPIYNSGRFLDGSAKFIVCNQRKLCKTV